MAQRIQIPVEYRPLFDTSWRNALVHGGRYSLKSHTVARSLLIRGRAGRKRIFCGREFQNSIADSSHQLLSDLIELYGWTDYVITKDSIVNRITGTDFIFKGLRHNAQSVKSIEGIDLAWIEEAQAISRDSIDILTPTVRKPGSQIIWTFNRLLELDPVWETFAINPRPDTLIIEANYDIAIKYGWMPKEILTEIEHDKEFNPALYTHKWLGQPMAQVDNAILGRTSVLAAMERQDVESEGAIEIGVDVARMGNDRTVFYKRKGLRKIDERVYNRLRTTDVCDRLEEFAEHDRMVLVKIDDTGVGGGVVDEMIKRGYNVMPINFGASATDPDKYPNLISEAWFHLAQIIDTVQLDMDSDLLMELTSRAWVMDSKGRRGVESKDVYKKRGYRSPDKADALILCYYNIAPEPFVNDFDSEEPTLTAGLLNKRL